MDISVKDLSRISSYIGTNPMLIQGAGGNTSIKTGNTLWVKASGFWLAHAEVENIFVPLDLTRVQSLIDSGSDKEMDKCILDTQSVFRPSIETTLHALLPQKVILHCHSVQTLALASRSDAAIQFNERLDGLNWAMVPYFRPGMPLTLAVREVLRSKSPDILILENHGLVIAAENCGDAEILLHEVESRLATPMRDFRRPDLDMLTRFIANSPYKLPLFEISHSLAMSPVSINLASNGSLYPDHVVFLGPGVHCLNSMSEFSEMIAKPDLPALILVKDVGALVRSDISLNAEEMVRSLALVVGRIPEKAPIKYLAIEQENELLGWDAEKYRKTLFR